MGRRVRPRSERARAYFFFPAGFLAFLPTTDLGEGDLVEAFFALLAEFAEDDFASPELDFVPFLLPNTWSQFCQNLGVVPVRTMGPLTGVAPRKMS